MDLVRKWERAPLISVGSRKFDQILQSQDEASDPFKREDQSRITLLNENLFVRKVSVFAEDGQNGKSRFSISLELDDGSDPSNHSRRTERVQCLTLEVEEKEIPVLARLAGRGLEILLKREEPLVQIEDLQEKILLLESEVQKLLLRKNYLEEQLQFAFEQLRTSS